MGTLLLKSVKCLQTFEEGLPRGDNPSPLSDLPRGLVTEAI